MTDIVVLGILFDSFGSKVKSGKVSKNIQL